MKKTTIRLMAAAICLVALPAAFAQTTINSASDITGNSSLSGGVYWLNAGSYQLTNHATETDPLSSPVYSGMTLSNAVGFSSGTLAITSSGHVSRMTGSGTANVYAYGLHIQGSDFFFQQDGGTIVLNGRATVSTDIADASNSHAYSMYMQGSNMHYALNGGELHVLASGTGSDEGGSNGSGNARGLYIDGAGAAFMQADGVVRIQAVGKGGTGGTWHNGSNDDGSAWGIHLRDSTGAGASYTQHGGMVFAEGEGIAQQSVGYGYGWGILIEGDNSAYTQHGGVVHAKGSGTMDIDGNRVGTGRGIALSGGNVAYEQNAGIVHATGYADSRSNMRTARGYGISIESSNAGVRYRIKEGLLFSSGETASGALQADAAGVYLSGSDALFEQAGGEVVATGSRDTSGARATGIFVNATNGDAHYDMQGGMLKLLPSNMPQGYAVHLLADGATSSANAVFASGAMLRPGVDFVAQRSGVMKVEGANGATASVSIDRGAVLEPWLISSIKLDKGQWLMTPGSGVTFIESTHAVTDAFTQPLPTITMDYVAFKDSGDTEYKLNIYRRNRVSEVTDGPVGEIARSLENNRDWVLSPAGKDYNDFYSDLDMMRDRRSAQEYVRKFSPWGTTRIYRLMLMNFDKVESALFSGMHSTSPASELAQNETVLLASADPGYSLGRNRERNRNAWLVPVLSYDTFNGKNGNYAKTDGYTAGLSFGASQATSLGTFGLTGSYLHNKQQGDGYTLKNDSFYVMGGYQSPEITGFGHFSPRVEAALGYGYASADQERMDANGIRHESSPDQQGVRAYIGLTQTYEGHDYRATPRFGLDYTYIRLDSVTENGRMGLKTSGDEVNSLRPKLGSDFAWGITDRLAVTSQVYARYELGDKNVVLSTGFAGTPIRWRVRGEESERLSGLAGVGFAWVPKKDMRINGRYQLEMGDGYNSHQVELSLNWQF